jgi:hypothetical protein
MKASSQRTISRLLLTTPRKARLVRSVGAPRGLSPSEAAAHAKLSPGGMGEWLKPAVLKTVSPERGSGVRIPLPPPKPRALCSGLAAHLERRGQDTWLPFLRSSGCFDAGMPFLLLPGLREITGSPTRIIRESTVPQQSVACGVAMKKAPAPPGRDKISGETAP